MKTLPFIALLAIPLTSCDVKVDNSDPPAKNTTIVTPGEKKVEHNTTVVVPKEEKKVETTVEKNTTIIKP